MRSVRSSIVSLPSPSCARSVVPSVDVPSVDVPSVDVPSVDVGVSLIAAALYSQLARAPDADS
jgi:hypothetical protein